MVYVFYIKIIAIDLTLYDRKFQKMSVCIVGSKQESKIFHPDVSISEGGTVGGITPFHFGLFLLAGPLISLLLMEELQLSSSRVVMLSKAARASTFPV